MTPRPRFIEDDFFLPVLIFPPHAIPQPVGNPRFRGFAVSNEIGLKFRRGRQELSNPGHGLREGARAACVKPWALIENVTEESATTSR